MFDKYLNQKSSKRIQTLFQFKSNVDAKNIARGTQ
jgi:hypothetical protein